jgi:hypothetical protein
LNEVELKECTARAAKDGALDELGENILKTLGRQVVQRSACKGMVKKSKKGNVEDAALNAPLII